MTSLAPTATTRPTTAYALDPAHTSVTFSVKHLVVATVRGRMVAKAGSLRLDPEDPASAYVEAEVDAASIDTGAPDRDAHLRSADFLDAANHPTLRLRTVAVRPQGPDRAEVDALLTIRGVERPVRLAVGFEGEATDPWGNRRVAFSAKGVVDRREFGLVWNQALETGGLLVGDTVRIALDAQFVAQAGA